MGLGAGRDIPRDHSPAITHGNQSVVRIELDLANHSKVASKDRLFPKLGSAETEKANGLVETAEGQIPAIGGEGDGIHRSPVSLKHGQQVFGPNASSPPKADGAIQAGGNQSFAIG